MFPCPVILIGVSDQLMQAVRKELTKVAATVAAEYHGADTALEGLRADKMETKLFIVDFESPQDATGVRRLVETHRGSPILALVHVAEHPENLLEANRAGATQLVPLPLKSNDLHEALTCLALQYRPSTKDCRIIAFTGSASGCGATTLATNAAYEMAVQYDQHTVLIELAQQMGILATNLDIQPGCTLSDLLADPEQMDAHLVQKSLVRVADNFDILAGSHGVGAPNAIPLAGVLRVLDYVKSLAQCVVLDVPCTYDELQFETLGSASHIVLVGEQSIASIRTIKLILDALRPGPNQLAFHVVMNRYDPKMEGLTAGKLEKALGLSNIRLVPDDRPGVLAAANEGKFLRQLKPHSPVLASIDDLVDTLLGSSGPPAPASGLQVISRFFRSLIKWRGISMSGHTVRVLHVEDDPMQQRLIAHDLKALEEYTFVTTAVVSEELAMECFRKAQFDLVVLDYQLEQGDGLHLLGRLREADPIVPIIAISGVATSEIMAQLIHSGADDYFEKRSLNSAMLAKSIRSALRRAEAVRKTIANRATDKWSRFTHQLAELCAEYVRTMGTDFLDQLDVVAKDLKNAGIAAHELQRIHDNATSGLEVAIGLEQGRMKLRARPLLFELLVRVYDDKEESST
jgi:pilus assembly protein CpaE